MITTEKDAKTNIVLAASMVPSVDGGAAVDVSTSTREKHAGLFLKRGQRSGLAGLTSCSVAWAVMCRC